MEDHELPFAPRKALEQGKKKRDSGPIRLLWTVGLSLRNRSMVIALDPIWISRSLALL